jgi:hypothetical protein
MSYHLPYRGLPRELRDKIYEAAVCPPGGIVFKQKCNIDRYVEVYKKKYPYLPHVQFVECPCIADYKIVRASQFLYPAKGYWADHDRLDMEWCHFPEDFYELTLKFPITTNLLLTNREMREEATPVLSNNTFDFSGTYQQAHDILRKMAPGLVSRIQSIVLCREDMERHKSGPDSGLILGYLAAATSIKSIATELTCRMGGSAADMCKYMLLGPHPLQTIIFHTSYEVGREYRSSTKGELLDLSWCLIWVLQSLDDAYPVMNSRWLSGPSNLHDCYTCGGKGTNKTIEYIIDIASQGSKIQLTLEVFSKSATAPSSGSNLENPLPLAEDLLNMIISRVPLLLDNQTPE